MAELFENVEINREPRWPIMTRLAAGSLALHAALVAAAVYVPAVRSALNIAYMFSDVQYVDEAYNKTAIGERAQVIEFPKEKFTYPEGYFAPLTPQPDPLAPQVIQQAQVVPPPPPPPIIRPTPRPSPSPVASPSPQPSPTPSPGGADAVANNQALTDEEKERKLDEIAAQNNIRRPKQINKKPFVDWLANAKKMKDGGQLNLSGVVEMTIEADRAADGKLSNVVVTQKTGDPKLSDLAKDLVAALSDSGALDFLEGTDHLVLTLKLDDKEVAVSAATEMESAQVAEERAKGYNTLLVIGALTRSGRDEAIIYKNTKATSNGKQVIVNFTIPRAEAGAMLSKQLASS